MMHHSRTGHGQHGDYLFGWKGDALQRGMDALGKNGCSNDVCSTALKIQSGKDAIACTKRTQVNENVGSKGECRKTKHAFPLLQQGLLTNVKRV